MPNLSYAALLVASGFARQLPIEQVSLLGSWLARWLGAGSRRTARAQANLKAAFPQKSEADRQAIVSGMWDNFGRTLVEMLVLDKLADNHQRVVVANPEVLDDVGTDGRGTVFVGFHFGNWEVVSIALARHGINPIGVYKPLKDQDINAWLERQRSRYCPGGLFPVSRSSILRLSKHVRAGGAIGLAGDYRDPGGPSVPFFGRLAASSPLPAQLAIRYGARLIAARVDRLPNAHFSVHLERVTVSDTGNSNADIKATTTSIQDLFEAWIRSDPGKWRWHYKRWDVDALGQS